MKISRANLKRLAAGKPPLQSEAEFQKEVINLAKMLKWRVAHFRASLNQRGEWQTAVAADGAGFTDLVIVRERVIFAELKAENGKLSLEQEEWIAWLKGAKQEVYVWRPSNWKQVELVLS